MMVISTAVASDSAVRIFHQLRDHILEHGLTPLRSEPAALTIQHQGNLLSIRLDEGIIGFEIEAVSENALFFLKEAVAHHLEECDPELGARLRWPDSDTAITPPNFRTLAVVRRTRPIPGMTRLLLEGDDLEPLTRDGIHVKLMLPAQRGRTPTWPGVNRNGSTLWPKGEDRLHVRYFTLRDVSPNNGTATIDFVDHQGGNISDWAMAAAPGDLIGVMGPGGGLPLQEQGKPVIIAGDMTALPAIARLLEELEGPHTGHLMVELPTSVSLEDYLPSHSLKLHRFDCGRFNSEAAEKLVALTSKGWDGEIWFGAEHQAVQVVRDHLRNIGYGLGRHGQVVAYWRAGVRGDARRED